MIVLCATMAGADDFVEIKQWSNNKIEFLRCFLPFEKGLPSHYTLNDVINALSAGDFSDCFISWVESLRESEADFVSIDGKTSRRAHNKSRGQNSLHLVSAWASRQRLILGQEACTEKSNEITAIPALLERLELTRALVTIDAMGCQSKIAKAILEHHEIIDGDHGRVESRRYSVCHDVSWLSEGNRFAGEWDSKYGAIVIRKAVNNRKLFPDDKAAMKVVYLAIKQASRKWTMPIRDWKPALNRFMLEKA